jgi:hypothetical protein
MSGGHFDYHQYHISDIAEHLERDIADIEYARDIGKVKKKEICGHLLDMDGRKVYPSWFMDRISRYDDREQLIRSLKRSGDIIEKDGKIYVENCNGPGLCEVVVYESESEVWADGKWHFDVEDSSVLDDMKKGLVALKVAAIYAQRIDWLLSGDDGEESFKRRLKEELDALYSKPLIDYEYWNNIREENRIE